MEKDKGLMKGALTRVSGWARLRAEDVKPSKYIFHNGLNPVDTETVFCPKCSRKNQKDIEQCVECGFPLKDKSLMKVIPIEFLIKRR